MPILHTKLWAVSIVIRVKTIFWIKATSFNGMTTISHFRVSNNGLSNEKWKSVLECIFWKEVESCSDGVEVEMFACRNSWRFLTPLELDMTDLFVALFLKWPNPRTICPVICPNSHCQMVLFPFGQFSFQQWFMRQTTFG